jgi:two-component system sensor histidine kinase/response regulator
VEDNVLNQEVATEILRSAGISVDVANNGKEAVEAVTKSPYDIVLMDVQMPVMGGYEATKRIRTIDRYKDLPIIAMTAHAMQGAREECLDAGMNDYISKPIDPDSLFLTIRKWVKPGAAIDRAPMESVAKKPENHEETISLPEGLLGIDIEAGVKRLNGNRKLYRKLLFDFAGTYSVSYDDINRALQQGDSALAMRLIHTLKGVAGNISAFEIQQLAAELEKALTRSAALETERLLAYLGKTVKSMKATLDELPESALTVKAQSLKAYDRGKAETLLLDLARLIWEDDVNAEQSLEEFQKVMDPSVYGDNIKALTESIGDYDFDTAKEVLQRIADKMNIVLGGY